MLRITFVRESELPTLKLEGKLSGPWVYELEHSWSEMLKEHGPARSMTVDLSDVTFISAEGKELLKSMLQRGAELHSRSLMTQFILSQIKNHSNGEHATGNGGEDGFAVSLGA
jgi:anti-anti-sigma regulatory factor